MSDISKGSGRLALLVIASAALSSLAMPSHAGTRPAASMSAAGSALLGINGSDADGINGSDADGINGSDAG